MYDQELTEIAKLVAAMVDADVQQLMEIHVTPGNLEVKVKHQWGTDHPTFVTHEIPWTFEVTPTGTIIADDGIRAANIMPLTLRADQILGHDAS